MRKLILSMMIVLAAMFTITSCGNSGEKNDADTVDIKVNDEVVNEETDEIKEEARSDVELSAEMKDFLSIFTGEDGVVEKALEKHAVQDVIDHATYSMFDYKEPKVMSREGDCYVVELSTDLMVNVFSICWTDSKITKMEITDQSAAK